LQIVAERVADGVMVIVFLFLAVGAFAQLHLELPAGAQTMLALATVLFGGALAAVLLLLARADVAQKVLRGITRFLPRALAARLADLLDAFIVGLRAFQSARQVATIVLLSLGVWALDSLAYFAVLSAFGALPDATRRVAAAPLLTGIINLGDYDTRRAGWFGSVRGGRRVETARVSIQNDFCEIRDSDS
jgi:hypothetical protein